MKMTDAEQLGVIKLFLPDPEDFLTKYNAGDIFLEALALVQSGLKENLTIVRRASSGAGADADKGIRYVSKDNSVFFEQTIAIEANAVKLVQYLMGIRYDPTAHNKDQLKSLAYLKTYPMFEHALVAQARRYDERDGQSTLAEQIAITPRDFTLRTDPKKITDTAIAIEARLPNGAASNVTAMNPPVANSNAGNDLRGQVPMVPVVKKPE